MMSNFTVGIQSPDLQRQIELLKYYPEIAEKHFYPAVSGAARDTASEIQPNIPVLTGKAVSVFRAKATGKGLNIEGRVGWWGSKEGFYIRFLEYGTSRIAPRHFMMNGFEEGQDAAAQRISDAATSVVNELAVP